MDELDDYGLTLTHREVEMILDALNVMGAMDDDSRAELDALAVKITTQTGVL